MNETATLYKAEKVANALNSGGMQPDKLIEPATLLGDYFKHSEPGDFEITEFYISQGVTIRLTAFLSMNGQEVHRVGVVVASGENGNPIAMYSLNNEVAKLI